VIVMSEIWQPAGAEHTRSVEEQFLDLLLADDDLIQAEFIAIIAAARPTPEPAAPTRPRRPRPRPETSSASYGDQGARCRTATTGGRVRAAALTAVERARRDQEEGR
jgi:hypothetical protein